MFLMHCFVGSIINTKCKPAQERNNLKFTVEKQILKHKDITRNNNAGLGW